MEWGIVTEGMLLKIKKHDGSDAMVIDSKHVRYEGAKMTFNGWGRKVTNWSSICIYDFAETESGKLCRNFVNIKLN